MRFVMNLLWFLLFGWIFFLFFMVIGIAFCISIICAHSGIRCIRVAFLAIRPFGCTVDIDISSFSVMNVVWMLISGIGLAALTAYVFFVICVVRSYLGSVVVLVIALIGSTAEAALTSLVISNYVLMGIFFLLFGGQCWKMMKYFLAPFGVEIDRD